MAPDQHEWISFDDAAEDRDEERTWMFDATFLRSSWKCIYGQGCKGVLPYDATALGQGCCSHGAHFSDDEDIAAVEAAMERLSPQQWQHHDLGHEIGILDTDGDDTATRVVDGACIFHNDPSFEGGGGCALHIGALAAGERPMDWKPDVCWQLPLRLEHHRDSNDRLVSLLREWKRRDWGEGGEEFHWWCTEGPEAFVGMEPVYRYLSEEITELVGEWAYAELVEVLETPTPRPIDHPAVRRRPLL